MLIEQKKISPNELALFFPQRFPIRGTIYYEAVQNTQPTTCQLIDNIVEGGNIECLLLTENFLYLKSSHADTLDDIEALALAEISEYNFSTPKIEAEAPENTTNKIKLILKIIVAPFLQKDGGDIELISFDNGIATVRFLGKCHGCPYAQRTLKERVEKNLIYYLPEVREVTLQ